MLQFYGNRRKYFNIPSYYNQSVILYIADGGKTIATGKWTNAGFVLIKGSLIRKKDTLKSNPGVINTKTKLLQTSLLIPDTNNANYYQLQEDVLLSAPSTSARLVFGNDRNGRSEWKDAYGDSLGTLLN